MDMREARIPCLQALETLESKCRLLGLTLKSPCKRKFVGLSKRQSYIDRTNDDTFEVERILDNLKDPEGNEWFLVKWRGWTQEFNSWEPKKNLIACQETLENYFEEKKFDTLNAKLLSKKSLKLNGKILENSLQPMTKQDAALITSLVSNSKQKTCFHLNKPLFKSLSSGENKVSNSQRNNLKVAFSRLVQYQENQEKLKEWEASLNAVSTDPAPIVVENYVDFEGPPQGFTYINDYIAGKGINIPDDPLVGCECADCFGNRKSCCASQGLAEFAYTKRGKVRVPYGTPIYECNKRCKCPSDCTNRVVQHGRKKKLAIFRTSNGRGWGVKTLEPIKKDSFVMEYVGEVITNEEAERRGQIYDEQGRTYLFDLDYNEGDDPFTVDAASYGNISHFMNHSCEPNLVVYAVWINTLDIRLPRLAFFANQDVKRGEELTFDYRMTGNEMKNRIACKCGTPSCRKFLV